MNNIYRIENKLNGTAGWQVRVFRMKQGVRFDFNKYFADNRYGNSPVFSLEAATIHRNNVLAVVGK